MVKIKRNFSYQRLSQFLLRPLPKWALERLGPLAFEFELFWIMGKLRPFLGIISRDPEYAGVERFLEYSWVLQKFPSTRHNIRVLDVGCGPSLLFCKLIQRGYETYSIDLSPPPLGGKYPKWSFLQADATKIPFKENTFDWIVAISTVEHIGNNFTWIKEFSRVLKEDGILLITVPVDIRQLYISPAKLVKELGNAGLRLFKEEYYKRQGKLWDEISLEEAVQLYHSSESFKLAPAVALQALKKGVTL